jgi:transposase
MFQRIPFDKLSDAQWDALRPHLARAAPQGRPMGDLRHRMDGMFTLIATDAPWRAVPAAFGKAGTIARHFQRLTAAGLWERLLQALHDLDARHPLQTLRRMIFRAARRAYRIRGLGLLVLARRLRMPGALPGPAWLLPDPDLSERLVSVQMRCVEKFGLKGFAAFVLLHGKALRKMLTLAGGRAHIPRAIRIAVA